MTCVLITCLAGPAVWFTAGSWAVCHLTFTARSAHTHTGVQWIRTWKHEEANMFSITHARCLSHLCLTSEAARRRLVRGSSHRWRVGGREEERVFITEEEERASQVKRTAWLSHRGVTPEPLPERLMLEGASSPARTEKTSAPHVRAEKVTGGKRRGRKRISKTNWQKDSGQVSESYQQHEWGFPNQNDC